MHRDILIFGFDIGANYLMIAISLVLMSIINIFRFKKSNIKAYNGVIVSILVNVFAIFSAILMYKLEKMPDWKTSGIGFSFFGTVFFLPIFMFIVSLMYKVDKRKFIDLWALTIPLELAFVRFACHLEGCCLGVVSSWGIHFPFDQPGVLRIPVQLIEVVIDIMIFVGLIIYEKKYKKSDGNIYWIFMTVYGFIRYLLEFIRDTDKHFFGMSNGQIFAIISFILGIVFIYINSIYKKQNK